MGYKICVVNRNIVLALEAPVLIQSYLEIHNQLSYINPVFDLWL